MPARYQQCATMLVARTTDAVLGILRAISLAGLDGRSAPRSHSQDSPVLPLTRVRH
jgi:hypothetical protein